MKDTRRAIKIPLVLYKKLRADAKKNHRTLAGQIATLLEPHSPNKNT